MLLILIYSFCFNVLLAASKETLQRSQHEHNAEKNLKSLSNTRTATTRNPLNISYFERSENVVRVPTFKNPFEDHKNKKKNLKKSPKRTIQKIIKKGKSKRRMSLNQATSLPTKAPMNVNELDKFYAQEEISQRNENVTTSLTQVNQNKKKKKWNNRMTRYPMPFQNLASKKDHRKRNKRSDDREDVFILTDLDEIEFLKNAEGDNVVKAHIKKYW